MPIYPLPVFEADLKAQQEEDRKVYEALKAPTTIVVRYGSMKLVGEFPYKGESKPGCGSKVVVATHRGVELGEMLTSTCPNAGCSKSVTRKEMLQYIENSGGRDYPFTSGGRVLRIATGQDMDRQASIEQSKHALRVAANEVVRRMNLPVKIVEVEPILGGERLTYYFSSEERIDFRDLVHEFSLLQPPGQNARIEMRQVGARDEARLTADYERCGQHCCCKQFLKVLKPVSMKSAKIQKATLDPLKISGRCGRLMCCLRYEDQTYDELRKRLPKRKARVGTPEGDGFVVDAQILTQLVLVRLDDERDVAVPVEELTEPGLVRMPPPPPPPPPREFAPAQAPRPQPRAPSDRPPQGPPRESAPPRMPDRNPERPLPPQADAGRPERPAETDGGPRRRRRRRGRPDGEQRPPSSAGGADQSGAGPRGAEPGPGGPPPSQGRRRRRRRRPGGPGGGPPPNPGPG
jgi:cell fate regulator YaaT (PSP1 superfamily)